MNILDVLMPVVAEDFKATISFYTETLGLALKKEFSLSGFQVAWLGPVVVLGSSNQEALAIPRQVAAIFVVDDLDAFWARLGSQTTVLVPPDEVPTGRRFIVRHPDGKAIEYLELRA